MPVLTNRKYEAFARALFEGIPKGVTQGQAYFTAGYKATGGVAEAAACRLLKNVPAIANRVAELQGALAKRKEITVASLVDELYEAVEVAKANGQAGAMVAASTLKARMAGLLRDKIEVTNVNQFKGCESIDDVARNLLIELCGFPPTPKMIEQAKAAFAQFSAELDAVAAGRGSITINAMPQPNNRNRRAFLTTHQNVK
jgi:hypothetical protein